MADYWKLSVLTDKWYPLLTLWLPYHHIKSYHINGTFILTQTPAAHCFVPAYNLLHLCTVLLSVYLYHNGFISATVVWFLGGMLSLVSFSFLVYPNCVSAVSCFSPSLDGDNKFGQEILKCLNKQTEKKGMFHWLWFTVVISV